MRKKKILLPRIYRPKNGDTSRWHVEFSVYDDIADKMQRFRKTEGFAKCKSERECWVNAARLKNEYTKKVLNGWTPFDDNQNVIWSDSLAYEDIKKKSEPVYRSRKNVAYYSTKFLKTKKNTAENSYRTYMSKLRTFRKWLKENKLDEKDISLISNDNAEIFIASLYKRAAKTKNEYLRLMNEFWSFIKKERKSIDNIWIGLPRYKNDTKPQRPLKKGIMQLLKQDFQKRNPQMWLASQFLYYCFIRPGELRQMKIRHLDLFDGKIVLYSELTKSSKSRVVDLSDHFAEILINEYHLHQYPEDFFVFTRNRRPGTISVSKNYFNKQFAAARKRLKLPNDYKFYAFKHTGAVTALRAGADIKEIQHQMGHSSVAITDEYLKSMVGYESEFFRKKMPEI